MVCLGLLPGWRCAPVFAAVTVRPAEVPFELDANGLVLVPVSLGALHAERCVLDTGSTRTLISERIKTALRAQTVARAALVSTGGTVTHEVVKLPSVTIGELTHAGLMATVLPADRMRAIAADASCVIGHDFLAAQDYTIDYTARTLAWQSDPGMGDRGARVPLVRVEGRYVAELPQSNGGDVVRLVPDSGASEIVLFRQPDLPPLDIAPLGGAFAQLAAATGDRQVPAVRLQRLRIGNLVIKDRPAYVVDRPRDEHDNIQGLLPLRLFARVSFNASAETMVLIPR